MRIFSTLSLLLLTLLFVSCGNGSSTETTEEAAPSIFAAAETALGGTESPQAISKLLMDNFSNVSDAQTGALNVQASEDFVRIAEAFSNKYPSDTTAALPLYRAAEVVRALNDPRKTAAIYQTIYERYPSFSKAPEALFMLGFTYDEDLKNLEEAKKVYNDFLERHPDHSFADDTEMLLKNLGKSDEEILRELEKQAGE